MSTQLRLSGLALVFGLAAHDLALAGTVALPVPGPVAGAALPVLIVAAGFAVWRTLRSRSS